MTALCIYLCSFVMWMPFAFHFILPCPCFECTGGPPLPSMGERVAPQISGLQSFSGGGQVYSCRNTATRAAAYSLHNTVTPVLFSSDMQNWNGLTTWKRLSIEAPRAAPQRIARFQRVARLEPRNGVCFANTTALHIKILLFSEYEYFLLVARSRSW